MRRVLVPLDGSQLAETVLPDALRLAGEGGELILIRDASWTHVDTPLEEYSEWHAIQESERYLGSMAQRLEKEGVRATAYRLTASDVAEAIDDAASFLKVDFVACTTHGRGPLGRLLFGGIVWKALAESRLPILLCHPEEESSERTDSRDGQGSSQAMNTHALTVSDERPPNTDTRRRILVPLDGSPFGETAIPTARQLGAEWKASLYLARVVADPSIPDSLFAGSDETQGEFSRAQAYLSRVSKGLDLDVYTEVFSGDPVDRLVNAVGNWGITDIVMSTHGRTGLKRVVLGSVADDLIQRGHRPTIVVPPLAGESKTNAKESVSRCVRVG